MSAGACGKSCIAQQVSEAPCQEIHALISALDPANREKPASIFSGPAGGGPDAATQSLDSLTLTIMLLSGKSARVRVSRGEPLSNLYEVVGKTFSIPCSEIVLCQEGQKFLAQDHDKTLQTLGLKEGTTLSCVRLSSSEPIHDALLVELQGDLLKVISEDGVQEFQFDGLSRSLPHERLSSPESRFEEVCKRVSAMLGGNTVYFVVEAATANGAALSMSVLNAMSMCDSDSLDKSGWHLIVVWPASPACVPLLRGYSNSTQLAFLSFARAIEFITALEPPPFTIVDAADWHAMGLRAASTVVAMAKHAKSGCYGHTVHAMLHPMLRAFEARHALRRGNFCFCDCGHEEADLTDAYSFVADLVMKELELLPDAGRIGPDSQLQHAVLDMLPKVPRAAILRKVHVIARGERAEAMAAQVCACPRQVVEVVAKPQIAADCELDQLSDLVVFVLDGDSGNSAEVLQQFYETHQEHKPLALLLQPIEDSDPRLFRRIVHSMLESFTGLTVLVEDALSATSFLCEVVNDPDFDLQHVMSHLLPCPRRHFCCLYRGGDLSPREALASSFSWGISPKILRMFAEKALVACERKAMVFRETLFSGGVAQVYGLPKPPGAADVYTLALDSKVVDLLTAWSAFDMDADDDEEKTNVSDLAWEIADTWNLPVFEE